MFIILRARRLRVPLKCTLVYFLLEPFRYLSRYARFIVNFPKISSSVPASLVLNFANNYNREVKPLGFLIGAAQRTAPQFRHPIFQLVSPHKTHKTEAGENGPGGRLRIVSQKSLS